MFSFNCSKDVASIIYIMTNTINYDKLYDDIERLFPDCPFNISCIESISELDRVFTHEPAIFIHDDKPHEYNY